MKKLGLYSSMAVYLKQKIIPFHIIKHSALDCKTMTRWCEQLILLRKLSKKRQEIEEYKNTFPSLREETEVVQKRVKNFTLRR